jgi:hypothetical protein
MSGEESLVVIYEPYLTYKEYIVVPLIPDEPMKSANQRDKIVAGGGNRFQLPKSRKLKTKVSSEYSTLKAIR